MCCDVACAFRPWIAAFAGRNAVRLLDPILHEYRLQRARDRPFQAHTRIAPVILVFAVAQPLIGDAVTERVADRAIENEEFAMRAMVEAPQVPPRRTAVLVQVHTGVFQFFESRAGRAGSAERIDEQTHLYSRPRLGAEHLDELALDFACGPHERLEMHRVTRRFDVRNHRGEQRAVLQHRAAIAFVHCAACQYCKRLHAVAQRRELVELQMQIRSEPPMREHEGEHRDHRADEHPYDCHSYYTKRGAPLFPLPGVGAQQARAQVRCGSMITDLWYKNAVVYSLDLETFMDGNGDGCGDFHGLMQRLDYLDSLGIDVIWLAPFQPSPNRDNGYDIADFYGVDPRHGSSGEFVEFMNQANKRGIGVIVDLVVNHTSDKHPWFQAARRDAKSPLRDWYIWSKKRPPGWNQGMVFPGVQKSVWTYDKLAREYFYHVFYDFQPDLNMDNPDVRAEILRIMGYWLELGVAGFRVDAVPFIIQGSPLSSRKQPKLHFDWLEEMRRFLQWRSRDAILLGEANVLPRDNMRYFGDEGEGIQMMFNFFVNQHLFYALASED